MNIQLVFLCRSSHEGMFNVRGHVACVILSLSSPDGDETRERGGGEGGGEQELGKF